MLKYLHPEERGVRICERNNYSGTMSVQKEEEEVLQALELGFLLSPWRPILEQRFTCSSQKRPMPE